MSSERLDAIRFKLDQLARRDSRRRVFGAGEPSGHGYVRRPPLDERQLSELEESFGVELLHELRLFLRRVHGGGAGPGYGLSVEPDISPQPRRSEPFPFDDSAARRVIAARLSGGDRWAQLEMPEEEEDEDDEGDWPPGPGFVPIAHHGCGVVDVIVTVGPQRGLIWCCDMKWCPAYGPEGRSLGFLDWYESWLDESLKGL